MLRGTAKADKLYGKGGNDRLYGLRGNDLLVGGPGADRVFCGAGRDTVQAGAGDRIAGDCEVVRGRGGGGDPDPPPPTSIADFRACPEADVRAEGPGFFCTTDRAGSTIAAGSRVYCTVRISNGIGKQAVIAFVRGGVEVAQTDSILITRSTHTLYAFVNAAQPGSWSCRVKVNGDTLREISFTVA